MNLALSELPSFSALPGRGPAEHHGSGIVIAPSLAYMERAYFDARLSGWSAAADHRNADPLDPRRFARAPGPARRLAVLPACRAEAPGRALVGRGARDGCRPHDRHGRSLCAGLQGLGHRPPESFRPSTSSATSALSAATFFMAASASTSSIRQGRCSDTPTTARPFGASTCAAPRPIPAAASPARPATMRRAR